MNNPLALPLVSVVLPCHNSARFIEATIASVLAQTYGNLELVAVDDCSTDSTPQLLEAAARRDARVHVVHHQIRGGRPSVTKNTGLAHIRGSYVCFIDHDDIYLPRKIEHLVSTLEENRDCVAAFHDVELVDSTGRKLNRYLENFLRDAEHYLTPAGKRRYVCADEFFKFQSLRYAALHTISVMIAVDRLPREQLTYDTRYTVVDDTDLWIRLGLLGRISYVDQVLAQYRQHENNITRDRLRVDLDAVALLQRNYARIFDRISASERAALRTRIASVWSSAAWTMRCQGHHARSARTYLRAFFVDPNSTHLTGLLKSWLPARVH